MKSIWAADTLAAPDSRPQTSSRIQAHLIWMHHEPMRAGKKLLLKHTTRTVPATVTRICHRVDVNTLRETEAGLLQMNDIGCVTIETTQPLHFDPYGQNRITGSFIRIDPMHNGTVAAGMIIESQSLKPETIGVERVRLSERIRRNGHPPAAVWIMDRPELAPVLERTIFARGWNAQVLSADEFDPDQLKAAARAMQASGAMTLFSVPAQTAPELQADIEAIFGREILALNFVGRGRRPATSWPGCCNAWTGWQEECMTTHSLDLNEYQTAEAIIHRVLQDKPGRACITSSFQAEDMVVLDIIRHWLPGIPVLFLDTGYHFRETYIYRDRIAAAWNLNLVNLLPATTVAEQERALGLLYLVDPAQCCQAVSCPAHARAGGVRNLVHRLAPGAIAHACQV